MSKSAYTKYVLRTKVTTGLTSEASLSRYIKEDLLTRAFRISHL